MTVRVFSDQAGTTAAAANDNIGKVEDLSKFDSDGVSSTTGPYLSVDANGFGSADILGQGGDVVQTFTNAIADGSALVVGTSKCIFFSNVNVEAGGTLTIGPAGDMINTNGLNLIGKVVSVATTTKVLTTAEQNSIATFFAERGASSVVVNDETVYDVNSVEADVVLDFNGSSFYRNVPHYFKLGGTYSTFADAFMGNSPKLTYNPGSASSSQSTMTNSSGEIVWAPHNLHRYSSDFSSWASKASITAVSSSGNELGDIPTTLLSAVAGSAQHRIFDLSLTEGNPVTFSFYVKPGTFDYVQFHDGVILTYWADFDLSGNGSVIRHTGLDATPTITPVTSAGQTFFKITVQYTSAANPTTILPIISFPDPSTVVASGTRNPTWTAAGTETLYIGGAHVYRSDLGGMNPVPGAATGFETYVPTNGAAVYLPRVGHHVFNGSTWVNEGLLIESEQRTNLELYSNSGDPASYGKIGLDYTGQTLRTTGPDGVADSMLKLQESTATSGHYATQAASVSVGTNTFSCIVKDAGDGRYVYWRTNNDGANQWINFNPATGEVTEVGTAVNDYGVIDLGNGFYRIWFSCDSADGSSGWLLGSSNSATPGNSIPSFAGTLEAGFYFGFIQAEAGSTPSSYIPTNGSQQIRGGQSLTVPAAWYDADNPTYTGPELVDTANDAASWTAYGTNTVADAGDAVEVTYVDNSNGAYVRLREDGGLSTNLVVGETYQVNFEVKVNSGSYGVRIYNGSSYEVADSPLTNTTYVAKSYTITPTSATGAFLDFSNLSSGEVVSIRNISVRQVSAPQFGWPEPEFIGPELVTDGSGNWVGDFDDAADLNSWTAQNSATASVVGGELEVVWNATSSQMRYYFTGLSDGIYVVSVDAYRGTADSYDVRIGDAVSTFTYGAALTQTNTTSTTHVFYANVSNGFLGVWLRPNSFTVGATAYFDNVSVREINPLSVSIQMDGRMTYADKGTGGNLSGGYGEAVFYLWKTDSSNYVENYLDTSGTRTGTPFAVQNAGGIRDYPATPSYYSPGILTPFNISSRHGSTFVNGAVDGVALTANTTPTALPDLSGTDLQIAYDFMGTIGTFRQFAGDIGDTGLVTATNPSTEPTLSLTFDGTGGSFYNLNWSE